MDDINIVSFDGQQRAKLDELSKRLESATSSLESARDDIRELRVQVLGLTTTCRVLSEMLAEKLGLDHGEVLAAIDRRLPAAAKPGPDAQVCPRCGNHVAPWRDSCLYCGDQTDVAE